MQIQKLGKAEKAIYTAFYELRMKYPIHKVKVVDICSIANVNKSTFYDHFQDVYDLTTKLECYLIHDSFKDFSSQDLFFDNPSEFVDKFKQCFTKYGDEFLILGNGREKELIFNVEDEIDKLFINDSQSKNIQILLTIFIGGYSHVMERFALIKKSIPSDEIDNQLTEFYKTILTMCKQ